MEKYVPDFLHPSNSNLIQGALVLSNGVGYIRTCFARVGSLNRKVCGISKSCDASITNG